MKYLVCLVTILFTVYVSHAQAYWQQRSDVKIEVRLDDKENFLHAYEEITYTNNSPDTLKYLYIHLWANAYKNDHTPFAQQMDVIGNTAFYYSKHKDRGYIDSLQFSIDGQSVDYSSSENVPDIARVDLPQPLLPGHKIKITTPFCVKIPLVFSRLGHDGQAYYISQWFPKPAVYDRKGWHAFSFLEDGEFYSEYGSYNVSITLPKNYIVMATGNCTDESEMKWLDDLSKQPLPNDTLYKTTFPASDPEMKTLHYEEDNVHDFAWFADKRWVARKDTVHSPGNNQLVTTWAAFLPMHWKQWVHATDYLRETVKHYGKWVGPYPYKTMKAVEGNMHAGGGMEYPTVTIIDKTAASMLKVTVIHEGGHNWFYGMLGTNERDHAWMDEGINTFYEEKTDRSLNTDSVRKHGIVLNEATLYYEFAATHEDQAIEQTSANFTKFNYGLDIYYKTALSLRWLEQYMGEEDFEKGMKNYYDTWRYKHPYPEDFEACMKNNTKKDIDWFFTTILHTDKKIDFTITDATTNNGSTEITVRNNTGVAGPALIDVYNNDSLIDSVWTTPFEHTATVVVPSTTWTALKIDDIMPDAKSTNNTYRRNGLFHSFGLKVKPVLGLNRSDKDKIFISPSLGYNQYDGFMLGLLFHNLTLPENRFRFAITPLYAFNSNTLTGAGSVGYLWYPDNLFKEILLQADAKSFDFNKTTFSGSPWFMRYVKIAPSLNFTFNEHDPLSSVTRTLTLKGYSINEDYVSNSSTKAQQQKTYGLLRYLYRNDRTYNPFSYSLDGQMGADFAKISVEGNVRVDYNVKNKALYIRAYLGKFFAISSDPTVYSRYELNASYTGLDDYLYDGTYFGRSAQDGIAAQQISMQEGGFKIPTFNNVDRSDNWLASLNLKTDLPLGKIPLQLFFDVGMIPNINPSVENMSSTTVLYDGGIELKLIKNFASVYFPIIMSSDFQNYLTNTYGKKNVFGRSISFTFQLQNINWLKTPSRLLKMGE